MKFEKLMNLSPAEQPEVNRNRNKYFPSRLIRRGPQVHPLPCADRALDLPLTVDGKDTSLEAYMARHRVAGLLIIKNGRIVLERYALGNDERSKWYSFSVGKSVVSTLVGAALQQGHIRSLDQPVTDYLPTLSGTAYDGATIRHLLQMSSGVAWNEGYRDGTSDVSRMYEAIVAGRPGGIVAVMKTLEREATPGTKFLYKTGETHLLGEIVTAATGKRLADYLSERIWSRFGMESDGYWILESLDGQETGGGAVNFTLRDYGRFGLFILGGGMAAGEPILPEGWIEAATHPPPDSPQVGYGKVVPGLPLGYGYQWWSFPPRAQATGIAALANHEGAFAGEGIFGQFLYINPRENLVAVHWGAWPDPWMPDEELAVYDLLGKAVAALRH